ncbi:hypothetical protein GXW74_25110 [Roseomonas eburnea]|uniref:Alpha/beta hydrolase n=1 Tax=Neoroseomonas eburnea TaxID=1346889 RepID=A0A9X9XJ95_9PROT|nr:hypothetical protein [Neoroseomonas eburnea]MBR0683781.1 hypothetical protein [Neoroseomonas eburnea]
MTSHRLAVALIASVAAAPARAEVPATALDLIWVTPSAAGGATLDCARLLALEVPLDWLPGDAAAVMLSNGPEDETAAARLNAALLAEETAVLHVVFGRAGGIGNCAAAAPGPVAEVLGALEALKLQVNAGVVVAIGLGAAGSAALEAVEPGVTARHLGEDGPRLAAAIALDGERRAVFRAGLRPAVREGWAARVPYLCAALAPLAGPGGAEACVAELQGETPVASLRPRR